MAWETEDQVNTKHQQIGDVEDNHATSDDLGVQQKFGDFEAAKKALGDLGVRNFDPSSFQLDTFESLIRTGSQLTSRKEVPFIKGKLVS